MTTTQRSITRAFGVEGPSVEARAGMTVTELILAMVIIGVMASLALPHLATTQRELRIENASRQLASDLYRARSEAIRQNQGVTLTRIDNNSYQIAGLGTRNIDGDIVLTALSADSVRFTPYGSLTTGGRTFRLTLAGETRDVIVSAAGLATIR